MHYCDSAHTHPLHQQHHDLEHGYPVDDERALFERLVMEINQPGLSWLTVLKKRQAFKHAFRDYDLEQIAGFGSKEIDQLLNNADIIRHRLKIAAVIANARTILEFPNGFKGWLDQYHPLDDPQWAKLFRNTFKFTGPSVTQEFLMSVGYLANAHRKDCPVWDKIVLNKPPWLI